MSRGLGNLQQEVMQYFFGGGNAASYSKHKLQYYFCSVNACLSVWNKLKPILSPGLSPLV